MHTDFNPDYNLPEHLQHMIDERLPALDIIHGEMKNWMYEAQLQLEEAQRIELCYERLTKNPESYRIGLRPLERTPHAKLGI
ncbi:MAG: hypothetical protein EB047_06930 [Chitinophagaceae bacterium]|nr:hypothetical protein [Chitinophagaceae bacterium]